MDGDVPSTPRQLLENLLGQGMVMVTIDARSDGAVVPRQFERDPQLRLNLSYRFGLPIAVDEWGVRARLTFSGVPFDCELPWSSIYMIVSHVTGQPFLFPEHVPQELMQLATQMRGDGQLPDQPKKPKLTVVASGDEAPEPVEEHPPANAAVELESAEDVDLTDDIAKSGDEVAVENELESEPPPPRTPPRRGHLRVVK
ncbi:MAG: ClpXP protease specificity-enhancing factor SspB [Myxococcota bacterium]